VARARATSHLIDDHGGRLETIALASLLETGAYARHLHQLRKTYLGRRDTLIVAMRRRFGAATRITGHAGGLHLVWHVPQRMGHAAVVADLARHHGLDAVACGERVVLIGFGAVDEGQLKDGVYRLADVFASEMDQVAVAGE
jgi:GntR family transcriptional regulator/MocR family aminotransferase